LSTHDPIQNQEPSEIKAAFGRANEYSTAGTWDR
jgi:hypothetical protein